MRDPLLDRDNYYRPARSMPPNGRGGDSIRFGAGTARFQRAEVHLSDCSFAPHRHDTYAIGVTLGGVQQFRYRGGTHACLPGQLHVLHPDELHDGAAGTDEGFGYRILYVAPELLRGALGRRALPFVADPVQPQRAYTRPLVSLLATMDEPVSDLAEADVAGLIADGLTTMGTGSEAGGVVPIDLPAVQLAREYLSAHAREQTPASTLEAVTGCDRYTLARHFRQAFGTSPDRYRTLRRLDLTRKDIEAGVPLAEAAARGGFADQSHLTRHFKRAFGFTPSRWLTVMWAAGTGGVPGQDVS
jgi:AraC-like DNA-binding protein